MSTPWRKLLPWLRKYLAHANVADTTRIAQAMYPIVGDSLADHQALAQGTPAARYIVPSDYLYVYNSRAHFQADSFGWGLRRDAGFTWDELEGAEFSAYDPAFGPHLGFAAKLANHGRISDPGAYVQALAGQPLQPHVQGLSLGIDADQQDGDGIVLPLHARLELA